VQFRFPDYKITVNIPNREGLLSDIRARFRDGRGFALATINLDHMVKLRSLADYRAAYARQDLSVADGNPIVWLSRIAGTPVDLVPGSDLLVPILQLAAAEKMPVGFYGSTDEVLSGAAAVLRKDIPGLNIVWSKSPPMGFDPRGPDAASDAAAMQAAGVRLCILSLSAPRQEAFAAFGRDIAPAIGFCSFGAGLDFVVGRQVRAPRWVQALALEWLWRALSSPRRLIPRYATCAVILPLEMWSAFKQRRTRGQ
jgi:exopolysaccharide biosynthesis WecB/TagA/CpsF family protein